MATFTQWAHKKPVNRSTLILPGIVSDGRWAKHLVHDLVPSLLDFEETSLAKQYHVAGFGRLLNLPGYTMDPWGLPEVKPESFSYQISDDVFWAMRMYIRTLFPKTLFRSAFCEQPVSIRKIANSGYPEYTTDLHLKTQIALDTFRHVAEIRKLIEAGDFESLATQHGMYYYMLIKRRFQADSVDVVRDGHRIVQTTPKARFVSAGQSTPVRCDKTTPFEHIFACRVRNVEAVSLRVNVLVQPLNNALNYCRFRTAPELCHATDIRGFLSKHGRDLRDLVPLSGDITQLDSIITRTLIEAFVRMLGEELGLHEWYQRHIITSHFSPWIANGIWHSRPETLPHIRGDWRHPDLGWESRINSLASGTQLTTAIGCAVVVSVTIAALLKMGLLRRTEEDVARYLRWEHPALRLNDMSDDVLHWVAPSIRDQFERSLPVAITDVFSGMEFKFDSMPSFLSNQIVQGSDGDWKAIPDVARAITKTLCPESAKPSWYMNAKIGYNRERLLRLMGVHGVADREFVTTSTKYPSYGLLLRNQLYSQLSPVFTDVWTRVIESLNRYNPDTWNAINALADAEGEAVSRLQVDATNTADLEFLLDPAKAQYKFSRDEISDGLFRTEYASLDPSTFYSLRNEVLE